MTVARSKTRLVRRGVRANNVSERKGCRPKERSRLSSGTHLNRSYGWIILVIASGLHLPGSSRSDGGPSVCRIWIAFRLMSSWVRYSVPADPAAARPPCGRKDGSDATLENDRREGLPDAATLLLPSVDGRRGLDDENDRLIPRRRDLVAHASHCRPCAPSSLAVTRSRRHFIAGCLA